VRKRDPAEPRLVNVRHVRDAAQFLWQLLKERPPEANISHREMPSWDEHAAFVQYHPYRVWYLIEQAGEFVGAIYVTRKWEIGISVAEEHRGRSFGTWAVRKVIEKWTKDVRGQMSVQRRAFLANIAPANESSKRFFESLGFRHVADVYALDV
jgi:RimJ/RimL family protein N-acetyltransferase